MPTTTLGRNHDENGVRVSGGGFSVFAHLTGPNAQLYRQVMGAFVLAKRRFTMHLRPEDVHEALGVAAELDTVGTALNNPVSWGNLRADPDTSRVTTVEDLRRARFLYQLTLQGEAVEEALARYNQALSRRGALQAVALAVADIATQLRVADALATEVTDRERLLTVREREVLENHLVNDVASTLQELISAADTQVAAMNGELEHRPTSTGMRLRLLWRACPTV